MIVRIALTLYYKERAKGPIAILFLFLFYAFIFHIDVFFCVESLTFCVCFDILNI